MNMFTHIKAHSNFPNWIVSDRATTSANECQVEADAR